MARLARGKSVCTDDPSILKWKPVSHDKMCDEEQTNIRSDATRDNTSTRFHLLDPWGVCVSDEVVRQEKLHVKFAILIVLFALRHGRWHVTKQAWRYTQSQGNEINKCWRRI
jgi:hypothetical protein